MEEEQEDYVDETPEFVTADDAVEVAVDEENVPMDEEDEEDQNDEAEEVVEMANQVLKTHTGPVYSVASYFDPATMTLLIVSGGGDDKAYLHKLAPNQPPVSQPLSYAHKDSVSCVALNHDFVTDPQHKLIAVGSYDGTIVLYNPDNGAQVSVLEGPTDVEWLCFHQKGGTVLLAGSAADGTIWMFHLPTQKCMQVFVGHESAVNAGGFTPDGRFAVSASSDGSVRVWAPKTGICRHTFRLGEAGLTSLGLGGGVDGQLIIAGSEDGSAHVCHIGNKKEVARLPHYESISNGDEDIALSVESVAFASAEVNANWCATGGVDGTIKIWDLANGASCRQTIRLPDAKDVGVTRLEWHPKLTYIFASTTQGIVHSWDVRDGRLLNSWSGHTNVINDMSIRFTDGGSFIVTGGDDDEIRLFEVQN